MTTAAYQARWRAKHPHYGLWLALRRYAKRYGEELHLTQADVRRFWDNADHKCERCHKPVEFVYGGGPRTRKRNPRLVKRDVFGVWAVDNLEVTCGPCWFARGES